MPKRTTIRIPDTLVTDIERWAKARGQGFATVCALAVEMGVKQAKETGELPSPEAKSSSKEEKKDN
ncbi:MAG: hypothetical protein AAFW84_04385 [Cyanobacteria bacterium J06635_15]